MMEKEIFRGFIKIHILYHASKEEICGIDIISELRRHGYILSPGTLYPVLHGMERMGYLSSNAKVVNGKFRKYYRITDEGIIVMRRARNKLKELVKEVLEGKV